jgi:hypothetical protein
VNMSTLPGPGHPNRQSGTLAGAPIPVDTRNRRPSKPLPVETATVTVLAFPATLKRRAAIKLFSF